MHLLDARGRPLPPFDRQPVPTDLKLFNSWPEQPPGGWTVEKIRDAITAYERGEPIPASRLERAFLRDARYRQAMRQALDTVLSLPLEVVAVERHGWTALARKFAEEGRLMLGALFADSCERWLMRRGETLNLGIAQIEWDTTVVPWRPVRLHEWPIESVRVDSYERRLYAHTDGGTEVEIRPGDGRWVVYDPEGWLRWEGLISCLGEPWVARTMGRRNLANRTDREAVAVIDAELPSGASATSQEALDYKAQLRAAQTGSAAGLLRPATWPQPQVLDLSSKGSAPLFEFGLEIPTTDMIVAWLGQDGTAKNEGGSLAKARVLEGVAYDLVERRARTFYGAMGPDGSREPGCITRQILRPWVLFQEGGEDDLVPLCRRVVPDLEEDGRLAEDSARATRFLAELHALRAAGYELTPASVGALQKLRGVRLPSGVAWKAPVVSGGDGGQSGG